MFTFLCVLTWTNTNRCTVIGIRCRVKLGRNSLQLSIICDDGQFSCCTSSQLIEAPFTASDATELSGTSQLSSVQFSCIATCKEPLELGNVLNMGLGFELKPQTPGLRLTTC